MNRSLTSASLLLMVSMTVVNAGNYVYNLILGRWLGPALFADLSLIVTLLLVVTFITVPLQMTTARYTAIYTADGDFAALAGVHLWTERVGIGFGLLLVVVFALGSQLWQSFFNTASAIPFIIFGVALPFSLLQGVERGILQGQTRFGILAVTYQVEMWTRFLIGIGLVMLGFSIVGAVLGISLSFVATWLTAKLAVRGLPTAVFPDKEMQVTLSLFALPVLVSQLGQILINKLSSWSRCGHLRFRGRYISSPSHPVFRETPSHFYEENQPCLSRSNKVCSRFLTVLSTFRRYFHKLSIWLCRWE